MMDFSVIKDGIEQIHHLIGHNRIEIEWRVSAYFYLFLLFRLLDECCLEEVISFFSIVDHFIMMFKIICIIIISDMQNK